jgi:hypothetical protein
MVAGFNETDLRSVMAGIAPDYVDEASGVRRDALREGLMVLFFEGADSTRGFLYRAELVPEDLAIEISPGRAAVRARIRFHALHGPAEEVIWDARIEGELQPGDDGWQWTRTTSINHSDRPRSFR